jgi:hypothetical protein
MSQKYRFTNFSDLYRAAFAEPNPNVKQLLLAEVKKTLDRWAENMRDGMVSSGKPVPAEIDPTCVTKFRHAA